MKLLADVAIARLGTLAFLSLFLVLLLWQEEGTPPRSADTYLRIGLHTRLREELGQWTSSLAQLETEPLERRPMSMVIAAEFLKERIRPHLRLEERRLFPLLDSAFARDRDAMTVAWRMQHQSADLWIDRLDAMAAECAPSAKEFVALGSRLAKLLAFHFDDEDGVLRPIFDACPELLDAWEGRENRAQLSP